jgi:erythromycin esterase-like protein
MWKGRREEVRGLVDFLEKHKEDQRFLLVAVYEL